MLAKVSNPKLAKRDLVLKASVRLAVRRVDPKGGNDLRSILYVFTFQLSPYPSTLFINRLVPELYHQQSGGSV